MQELFVESIAPLPLSKGETENLFYKMAAGDINARNTIIEHNIRLVLKTVIKKFYSTSCDMQELVSIGLIGLIKSVDTFDITKGIIFSTYAIRCIYNEIVGFIRSSNKYKNECSLDSFFYDNGEKGDLKNENILFDPTAEFLFDYENKETYKQIREIVSKLPGRDRQIVEMYFGFNNKEPMEQSDIAKILGISQSYISRIISRNLKQISYILEQREIMEFHSFNLQNIRTRKKTRTIKK